MAQGLGKGPLCGLYDHGGKDEAAGNKSCKLAWDGEEGDALALEVRLPDALVTEGEPARITMRGITLPGFARAALTPAIARNRIPGDRIALTYRFVRDPGFRHATLSAWRVCITVKEGMPKIDALAPATPRERGPRMGVDINAGGVALALIGADGNPLRTWWIPVVLRGLSSGAGQCRRGICQPRPHLAHRRDQPLPCCDTPRTKDPGLLFPQQMAAGKCLASAFKGGVCASPSGRIFGTWHPTAPSS